MAKFAKRRLGGSVCLVCLFVGVCFIGSSQKFDLLLAGFICFWPSFFFSGFVATPSLFLLLFGL